MNNVGSEITVWNSARGRIRIAVGNPVRDSIVASTRETVQIKINKTPIVFDSRLWNRIVLTLVNMNDTGIMIWNALGDSTAPGTEISSRQ